MRTPVTSSGRHVGLALALLLTLVVPLAPPATATPEAGPDADTGRQVDPAALAACVDGAVTALAPAVAPDRAATACEQALRAGADPAWVHAVGELRMVGADLDTARVAPTDTDRAEARSQRPDELEDRRGRRLVREASARQRGVAVDEPQQSRAPVRPTPQQQAEAGRTEAPPRGGDTAGEVLAAPIVLAAGTGSISGTVTEQGTSTPLPDMCVEAWTDLGGAQWTTTSAGGTYTLADLEDGDWFVTFTDCGAGTHLTEYWLEAETYEGRAAVAVAGGALVEGIDATLSTPGSISGTVTSEIGGAALADICVSAYDEGSGGYGDAVTDATGAYLITGLPTGNYQVYFEVCFGADLQYASEYYDNATWENSTPVVVIAGAEASAIDAALTPGASISGTVTAEDGGAPLAGICVTAWDDADSYGSTETAGDGTYTVTGLRAGPHLVEFYDCDLVEPEYLWEVHDGVRDYEQATPVTAVAGDTVGGIDASLQLGGSISGTVVDADGGAPLLGMCVDAVDAGDGTWGWGETDADGAYTIADLPPGDYLLHFYDCYGSSYVNEWYDDTDRSQATPVVVGSGADVTGFDADMSMGGGISGTVVDLDGGAPLEGICVDAYSANFDSFGGTETGPDGSYEILGLSPGPHYVEFHDCNGLGYANEFFDDAGYSAATLVTVAGTAVTPGIDAELGPGRSLSGTVTAADTGMPLGDVCVDAEVVDGSGWSSSYGFASTDPDGTYTVTGLGPGDYTVEFYDCGWEEAYVGEFYDDVALVQDATPVPVISTADVGGIDAVLQLGGAIEGTVTDTDSGSPLEGICVYADSDTLWRVALTANDGTYRVAGLPSGSYIVEFYDCADGSHISEFHADVTAWEDATPVAVTAPDVTAGIDADLLDGGSISGTVTAATGGGPVGDICVDAYDATTTQWWSSTETAEDGTYSIGGLPGGDYHVEFWDCGAGGFAGEYYDNAADAASATPVTVLRPQDTPGIDAVLSGGGSIAGTVTAADGGAPLTGICVGVDDWGSRWTRTAADGTYVLPGLAEGDWTVEFWDCGTGEYLGEWYDDALQYVDATPVFVGAEADVAGIDAALAAAGSLSGTVTNTGGTPLAGVCVDVFSLTDEWFADWTETATDGTWSVPGLSPGDYVVNFYDCSTGTYFEEWYDDAASYGEATPISVALSEDVPGIDAVLAASGTGGTNQISGTVTAEDGGATLGGICVDALEVGGFGFESTTTASDGTYLLSGLADADWKVEFTDCRDAAVYVGEYWNDAATFQDATAIPVAGTPVTGIDAALATGGAITGVVTDAVTGDPLGDICLYAGASDLQYPYTYGGVTGSDGSYRLGGIDASGSYHLVAYECADPSRRYLDQWYDGAADRSDATEIGVTLGLDTAGVDLAMVVGGWVEGTVTAEQGGGPLSDVCVEVSGANGAAGFGYTATDGTYDTNGLPPGTYTVYFYDCGVDDVWAPEYHDGVHAIGSATPITVTSDAATVVDADLVPYSTGTGSISGVVERQDGSKVANAFITSCAPDGRCVSTWTDAAGAYLLDELADGTYSVRAAPPTSALQPGTTTVDVTGGGAAVAPTIVLAGTVAPPAGVSVGGTAGGSGGGLPVVYYNRPFDMTITDPPCESGEVTYTITGPNGEIETGTLTEDPPGTWSGDIIVPFTGTSTVEVSQAGCGETIDFNIYIDPSGSVRTPEGDPVEGATVTLYRSDTGADGTFTVVEDGSSVMAPSNRTNPDLSDAEGAWGWDVEPGYYYVTAEKDGCVDPADAGQTVVSSPVYEIPPAVTDVDLRLDCGGGTGGLEFVPVDPCAVFDTRFGTGAFSGWMAKDSTTTFKVTGSVPTAQGGSDCGPPPADAVAVELNLVALDAKGGGNLQIAPSGTIPNGGVVNFVPGVNNSNALSVEVDADGEVDVTVKGAEVRLRGVVLGYYTDVDASGLEFVPVDPCAVFDTRFGTGAFSGWMAKDSTVTFDVTGSPPASQGGATCTAPPADAVGIQLNLIALDAKGGGNLQIAPSGTIPNGGVVNFVPGVNNSNALSVEVDADGEVDVTVKGAAVRLRGVVLGYYTDVDASGLEFVPVDPCAVFDTRYGTGGFAGPFAKEKVTTFTVTGTVPGSQGGAGCTAPPADAAAVHLNLIAVNPTGGGNLQIAPAGAVANGGVVNFVPDQSNSNALDVEVASGAVDVTVKGGSTHVRGVVLGYRVTGD